MPEVKRYAIVSGGQVVNVTLWDGETEWAPPEGQEAIPCPEEVGIGWSYADGDWTAPEPSSEQEPA